MTTIENLMKKLLILLLLALSACEPVYPTCSYCNKQRPDARIYACRKCGNTHRSCKAEAPLHSIDAKLDKDGVVAGRSIKVCPEGISK
jgi:hypothetical protein